MQSMCVNLKEVLVKKAHTLSPFLRFRAKQLHFLYEKKMKFFFRREKVPARSESLSPNSFRIEIQLPALQIKM